MFKVGIKVRTSIIENRFLRPWPWFKDFKNNDAVKAKAF